MSRCNPRKRHKTLSGTEQQISNQSIATSSLILSEMIAKLECIITITKQELNTNFPQTTEATIQMNKQ